MFIYCKFKKTSVLSNPFTYTYINTKGPNCNNKKPETPEHLFDLHYNIESQKTCGVENRYSNS